MRNVIRLVVALIVVVFFVSSAVYAASDAGNKICPVCGNKASGKDFGEYSGKSYGLCCQACSAAFEKDPAKYSAIADKEAVAENTQKLLMPE